MWRGWEIWQFREKWILEKKKKIKYIRFLEETWDLEKIKLKVLRLWWIKAVIWKKVVINKTECFLRELKTSEQILELSLD